MGEHSIKEHIISSQMRRINRELPISEVYHERSLGLGLAPPLSKLILSNNIAVAQVDHHPEPEALDQQQDQQACNSMVDAITSFDSLSVVEDVPLRKQQRPLVPPKPAAVTTADQWSP